MPLPQIKGIEKFPSGVGTVMDLRPPAAAAPGLNNKIKSDDDAVKSSSSRLQQSKSIGDHVWFQSPRYLMMMATRVASFDYLTQR